MARPRSGTTTIYTLSALAGVSPSTISRALSNAPSISAEVRARIQELARAHNFQPRVVVTRAPNICALIQREPLDLNGYLVSVIEGIAKYCYEENLEMSLFSAKIEEFNRVDIVREFRRRNASGAILLQSSMESRFVQALDDAGFPYYNILGHAPARAGRLLTVDNRQAARCAVQHLLELGHRKIALLASGHVETSQLRLQAYREILREAGIPVDEQLILAMPPDQLGQEFGYEAVSRLLHDRPDVTAIFTLAHNVAVGALRACYQLKVRVPEDVSLITCDDFPLTAYLCPALTAIRIPNYRLGYLAARQVHRLIRNLPELPATEEPDTLQGELIVRESTAPPRRSPMVALK